MATWPCPRCGRLGEINADGPYYQTGGRSICCGGCGAHFMYGESAPPLSEEPPAPPRPWIPARPFGPRRQSLRRDAAIATGIGLGGFAVNLLLLLGGEPYYPIFFVIGLPVGLGGLVVFLNTYRGNPSEMSDGLRGLVLLLGLLGFAFGVALAFAPRDVLTWIGLIRG
jgi:hypothetical protein